jgi:3-hydroxyisobutyrate dehydrogenase-like beta-hydroxyacid dehydrogenase
MMRVGVVGLGKMGSAIARNLLARGYQVSVWNRSRGSVDALVGSGATPQASIEELVKAVDTVLISLWGDEAARDVTLDRVIPAARGQQLIIEMSTLSPSMYETLESAANARSVEFLAAPVLGSVNVAQQGSLTILAGGLEATFERARPLLDSLGTTVTFTGSASASGVLKLANNTVIGVVAETIAELLQLCDQGGIDHRLAVEAVSGAFARVASSKTQQLLDRDSEPRFSLNALLKDLQLAREAAESLRVPLSMLDCVVPAVQRAAASGLGDRDYIALALERTRPASSAPHG